MYIYTYIYIYTYHKFMCILSTFRGLGSLTCVDVAPSST